jgi:hypothetical protein
MKKLSIITILVLTLFGTLSCNKKNDGDGFYIKFKVNGTTKEYTGYVVAHVDVVSGTATLTILGAPSATTFDDYMGIYIANDPSGNNITAGIYEDLSGDFTVLTTYASSRIEYEAGQSVAEDAAAGSITIPIHFNAIINSMSDETVKGSFSGSYYADGDVENGTRLDITEGEFYAEFQ